MRYGVKIVLLMLFCCGCALQKAHSSGPFQASGIKIGEVTDTEAIIWTRLSAGPRRLGTDAPMPRVSYDGRKKKGKNRPDAGAVVAFPGGSIAETLEGAVGGTTGRVRVLYKAQTGGSWKQTDWRPVDPQKDYTRQFRLTNLSPKTKYLVRIESQADNGGKGQTIEGGFRTAPGPDRAEKVVFTVSTGQYYPDQDVPGGGYKIYGQMLKLDPDFFVHTGDILYYDKLAKAKSLPLARRHWWRMYSLPTNVEFHRQVASYFMKDDHDTWKNDCWPTMKGKDMGDFTFKQGQAVFLEQVPMGEKTWRTYRWGKDLQIWLVEGRDFRSPNPMPDGPDKTIWGKQQKRWFKRTVAESDATFKILISPTPIVGPDRTKKNDNHANKGFTHEGDELRQFISKQKNMYVVCGDRHWQYVSQHAETGVREYCCGPASNEHAGGWKNSMRYPEHKYLNVTGGFLAGTVERKDGKPTLTFRHYSVDGKILNEDRLPAE